ncbi:MAG TPA: hypothetical protein VM077_05355 [Candidatus Limnocylindrales bacterium]|nr:hypothetical protein [Candidatus Limnocylindrales bacterium]
MKNSVKDLKISNSRLEKGQIELRTEQIAQGKKINGINKTLDGHGKSLDYIKAKLIKTAKTVDIIGLRYDERIVDNDRRIDRIEDRLDLPPYKAKQ